MGRTLGPVCRMCRREGMKLFLKGLRCETAKCPVERQDRNKPPGMASWRRGRSSDYGIHLREKQKVKRYYGVLENQFRSYYKRAVRMQGNTGEELLGLLERRLDNVIYKLNFASSRKKARQIIAHGHIHVNGRKVDVPSYLVRQGDKISLKAADKTKKLVKSYLETEGGVSLQTWLQVDAATMSGVIVALPTRDDVQIPVEEQLVVEFCSR
ncbi:MAG: 30S ribosomal protein S4 [Sedimentisphaerales bacterium]|nr:30S ribosomal protein S4 [Sedimentisphaerales bacterium]